MLCSIFALSLFNSKVNQLLKIVFTPPAHGDDFLEELCIRSKITCVAVKHAIEFTKHPDADLFIDARFNGYFAQMEAPLLFHSPAKTFENLPKAPPNSARFCAWPGFWERSLWEIAVQDKKTITDFESVLHKSGIPVMSVKDIAGLIAPRILCTIINEAVFTLADNIASTQDIDTAMKLGTNYPKGPIEWAQEIGIEAVEEVLMAMSAENPKYSPHPEMKTLLANQ